MVLCHEAIFRSYLVLVGEFTHQFNDEGTFYYTTGVMGLNRDIELRGKVVVTAKQPFVANVSVEVGGQRAESNHGSGLSAIQ